MKILFSTRGLIAAVLLGGGTAAPGSLIPVSVVTASSFYNDLNPVRTINASGITGAMTTEGQVIIAGHDNNGSATTMWHSAVVAAAGQWLSWSFASTSDLRTLYYWNHNQSGLTDRGIQNVNIKISKNNGATFTSLGDFVLTRASGQAGERCRVLELPATQIGVTNVRFDIASNFGGNVVGLSEIRFSTLPAAVPDPEVSFASLEGVVLNYDRASGERVPVNLSWATTNANAVTITPGIGSTDLNSGATVTPPSDADTVYTLSAQGAAKTVTLPLTVRTVAGGSSSWRYVRFTPVKLRNGAAANSIQIAEFDFLDTHGDLVQPVTVTNPGGNNPAGQEPGYVIDGKPDTKWLDFNRAPLVFDFGATPGTFVDYQLQTAGDAQERDPVRWILEGSSDNANWTLLDNVTAFDYPTPVSRGNLSIPIPLPGVSLQPLATFGADNNLVQAGDPVLLRWETTGAATVSIDHGIGTVTSSGTRQVIPAGTTTYTLTATTAAGKVVTSTLTIQAADFPVKTIAYPNFNAAGAELALLRGASVLSEPRATSDPTGAKRLRINDDTGSVDGTVWFRRKQNLAAGFESNFSLNFLNFTQDPLGGADGLAFVIQNSPQGAATVAASFPERGLAANAVNITFDSYKNDDEESSATVQVRSGAQLLRRVDLSTFPGIVLTKAGDLTQIDPSAAPYQVRVTYLPGDLDVYVNGVLVIDSLSVDLGVAGALDGQGMAYVGFSGRSGGAYESHDVTIWSLVTGPPAGASAPLAVTAYSINPATGALSLTWRSTVGKSYRITGSSNLAAWSTSLKAGIAAAAGSSTTATTTFVPGAVKFFRVEEE